MNKVGCFHILEPLNKPPYRCICRVCGKKLKVASGRYPGKIQGNVSKNKETFDSFIEYCNAHPEYRFWQAMRNWLGVRYIILELENGRSIDSFYIEGKMPGTLK